MYLDAAKKQEIFGKYGKSNTDTGSAEAQVALFSYRISHLTEHMIPFVVLSFFSMVSAIFVATEKFLAAFFTFLL